MIMRKINRIILHCTANPTKTNMSDGEIIEMLRKVWRDDNHWQHVGYHYLVLPNGNVYRLADDNDVTNGAAGINHDSIHVAYYGGKLRDDITAKQVDVLTILLASLKFKYGVKVYPHSLFGNKACPNLSDPLLQKVRIGYNVCPVILEHYKKYEL